MTIKKGAKEIVRVEREWGGGLAFKMGYGEMDFIYAYTRDILHGYIWAHNII